MHQESQFHALVMLQQTLRMTMHPFFLHSPRLPTIRLITIIIDEVLKDVNIFNNQAQNNSGFLEIESHQRHLFMDNHYDTELPSMHNRIQIDTIIQ